MAISKESFNVCLVGYGSSGQTFHAPLIDATSGLSLSAVVSSRPESVAETWPYTTVHGSIDQALNDPDIDLVVIATPNGMHFAHARQALAAGKHVVVDKPFTVTSDEAQQLAELAQAKGCVLSVFHNRRWDADFLTIRKLLDSGALGEIVHFESHFDRYRPHPRVRWREQALPGSGIWYDLGSHLVDQALQLFGEPDAITADLAVQRLGAETDDYAHVVLHYGPRRAILHASALVAAPQARFTVHGRKGSFAKYGLDPQENCLKLGRLPDDPGFGVDPLDGILTSVDGDASKSATIPTERGNYRAYYEGMRDAVLGVGPNPVPAEDGVRVVRILELGEQSAREGRTVRL
jgi:predicted dehydrogenase